MTNRETEPILLGHRAHSRSRGKPAWSQRKLEIFFWLLAILVTLISMLHAAGWTVNVVVILFMAWAMLPYVVMYRLVSNTFRSRHDRPVIWVGRLGGS